LVKIWEEVIGVSPLGVFDQFFEVGGHSLSGDPVNARIEKNTSGAKLPLSILIHSGTVRAHRGGLDSETTVRSVAAGAHSAGRLQNTVLCMHPSAAASCAT